MKKWFALAIVLLTMAGLAGCAADGAYNNPPNWQHAPNRQAGSHP